MQDNRCPLCGENNVCANPASTLQPVACWCMDSSIQFSEDLLKQVADRDKNQVCICKTCALSQQLSKDKPSQ